MKISVLVAVALAALPVLASADPYADFAKFQQAFAKITSYRSATQAQYNGMSVTITDEHVEPDRDHVVMQQMEAISIGKELWVKTGGSWSKIPDRSMMGTALGPALQPAVLMLLKGSPRSLCTAQDLGIKDGYHAISCQMKSGTNSGTVVLYLRPDFLPAKVDMQSGANSMTTTYSDFNAPIVINQP